MEGKIQKIALSVLALIAGLSLSAQNGASQKDSLVRLIKAESLQLIDQGGGSYRKAVKATFFHNNTYLICDTALWNVDKRVINSWGNVKVVQEGTILSSDKMDYLIDDDMVQFRGTLVQLQDKDRNTLRTHYLDYNTKDSLAFFSRGGAMKDKDGQIIESTDGSYDARKSLFEFRNNVNMFTDSIFIRTTMIDYESDMSRAVFSAPVDFWKDDNMLSADGGWYERLVETFFFNGKVHAMSKEQEAWSDSLYYYRTPNNVLMLSRVQLQDTTRNVSAVGNRLFYEDSLRKVTLSKEAAVALRTEEKGKVDTLYLGADTLIYHTVRKCDIPEGELKASQSRLEDIHADPVSEYRRKAMEQLAEARRKQEEENAASNPMLAARGASQTLPGNSPGAVPSAAADSSAAKAAPVREAIPPADSLTSPADSLKAAADSLAAIPPPDTTRIGFVEGIGKVKLFRTDMQVSCDSLRFTELDSIARFYIKPVVWQNLDSQYSSDSLAVLVKGHGVDRASLMSNAFIITRETPELFDQIRSTEAMAYFDTTAALRRFDALGGANAIFFLKEKEEFATVNKVECKMLSAYFKDGEFDNASYFDSAKNDAYPLPALKTPDRTMKGFNWQPDLRPKGKEDITDLSVRPSERKDYESHPKAEFRQTDIYFPGYMKEVYAAIQASKNRPKTQAKKPDAGKEEPAPSAVADSIKVRPDSLSTAVDSLSVAVDTLKTVSDTLAVKDSVAVHVPTKKELREQAYQAKIAAREAKWARADSIDAARDSIKAEKKMLRKKEAEARKAEKLKNQYDEDRKKLEKYVERYRRKYARRQERENRKKQKSDKSHGKDSGQVPEVRESGHSEQREFREPALDKQAVEPVRTPVQGTE